MWKLWYYGVIYIYIRHQMSFMTLIFQHWHCPHWRNSSHRQFLVCHVLLCGIKSLETVCRCKTITISPCDNPEALHLRDCDQVGQKFKTIFQGIFFSWIFYLCLVTALFVVMAMVKIPSLNKWSGCTMETCTRTVHRVRHSLIIICYIVTIVVFTLTGA